MLERLVGRVLAAWVAADAVYGPDTWLRAWLRAAGWGMCSVSGRSTESPLSLAKVTWSGRGRRSDRTPGGVRLVRVTAGAGVQGPRWWDWARLELPQPTVHGHTCWLLVRRHPQDPTELAFFVCAGPPGTPLAVLARVEGARWDVEEALQTAKGDTGLDHCEVRRYDAWYRHATLSLLAAAFLAVQRAATGQERGVAVTTLGVLISLSARELRHLLARLVWPPATDPARVWAWSVWRRRHQARARPGAGRRPRPLHRPSA